MKKETYQALCVSALTAFLLLLICTRSSILYPFNNWDDSNSYFTMGKLMMNNGVIYRDAFDQKGPLLYFIYGIGYLISHTTFLGVFLLEILSLTVVMITGYNIARLFLHHWTALIILPFLALSITASQSFYWGGCAEEFCLPFLSWGLYASIRYFKTKELSLVSDRQLFLYGMLAGCILLIKYTLLGFYFAFIGMLFCGMLSYGHRKQALRCLIFFPLGMLLPLIPWLIYFRIHGALDDWYQCYIYCNIFLYSDLAQPSPGIGNKIYSLAKIMYWLMLDNPIYFIPILVGFCVILINRKIRFSEKINLYALFGFLFLGIYIGGTTLYYYSLPLSLFSVTGWIAAGALFQCLLNKLPGSPTDRRIVFQYLPLAMLPAFAISLLLAWNFSMNTPFMKQSREDFFLFRFRDIVRREESPSLLNIGCLDAGLYTAADILPTCRYFQSNAVRGFDEVAQEQLQYIKEGKTTFILARDAYPEEIYENYILIDTADYEMRENTFTYYLFKLKCTMEEARHEKSADHRRRPCRPDGGL